MVEACPRMIPSSVGLTNLLDAHRNASSVLPLPLAPSKWPPDEYFGLSPIGIASELQTWKALVNIGCPASLTSQEKDPGHILELNYAAFEAAIILDRAEADCALANDLLPNSVINLYKQILSLRRKGYELMLSPDTIGDRDAMRKLMNQNQINTTIDACLEQLVFLCDRVCDESRVLLCLSERWHDEEPLENIGPDTNINDISITVPPDAVSEGQCCSICLEHYDHDHGAVELPCMHLVGSACMSVYINTTHRNSNTCPECRSVLFEQRPRRPIDFDDIDRRITDLQDHIVLLSICKNVLGQLLRILYDMSEDEWDTYYPPSSIGTPEEHLVRQGKSTTFRFRSRQLRLAANN